MTVCTQGSHWRPPPRTAAMGHKERFPPPRLSAGYGFRKETTAGVRHDGRDAPILDLPALAPKREGLPVPASSFGC